MIWLLVIAGLALVILALGATTAEIGYGHHLAYSPDGTSWTNVLQVVDINGPDVQVVSVKVTNTDSPGGYQEKIPGLADAGQATCNTIYSTAGLTAIFALVRLTKFWRIVYADTHVWQVSSGFLTKLADGSPLEDRETLDVTIEWSGAPTYT